MIDQAVANLYKVFSVYPGNRNMVGSPLYGEKVERWNQKLFSKPLRELTSEELARFSGSVTLTWGNLDDYKHFLPRIYELIASYNFIAEIWVVFDILNKNNWVYWPNKEVSALDRYFVELWKSMLQDENGSTDYFITDYLSSIANVYSDFNSLLTLWCQNESKQSTRKIAVYFTNNYKDIFIKNRLPGFHNSKENGKKILDWITSPVMKERLNRHQLKYRQEDFGIELKWLVDTVNAIK